MSHVRKPNYHEFLDLSAGWQQAQWGERPVNGDRQLLNEPDPYKWSGENPPPAIGAKVKVYMNGFGNGTVVGYFAEYGWLGVLVKIAKPPAWWVRQCKDQGESAKPARTLLWHRSGTEKGPCPVLTYDPPRTILGMQ